MTNKSENHQRGSQQPLESSIETSEANSGDDLSDLQDPKDEYLADIYKVHVEEYRYNVSLTWDRTRYLLALNSTLTVGAMTLFRFSNQWFEYFFVASIFLLTILTSLLSVRVATRGKEYFRNARTVLRLAEIKLGMHSDKSSLFGLGIASTGIERNHPSLLKNDHLPTENKKFSVTETLKLIFYVIMTINFIGISIAGYKCASLIGDNNNEMPHKVLSDAPLR